MYYIFVLIYTHICVDMYIFINIIYIYSEIYSPSRIKVIRPECY